MSKGKTWRLGGFVVALGASAGLIASASGATGAYFSDTKAGVIDGTVGAVHVTVSGGDNGNGGDGATTPLNFNFTNLMPGTYQDAKITYTNTGTGPEDIWLVFPNAQALHALNNMGRYGAVTVSTVNNSGSINAYFHSSNLMDGLQASLAAIDSGFGHCSATAGLGSPSNGYTVALATDNTGCYPLPGMIKLAAGLSNGSGNTGTVTFSFALGTKFDNSIEGAGHFLLWPLVQDGSVESANHSVLNQANQVPVGSPSAGLPYQIVATQPGIMPGQAGSQLP